MTADRIDQIIRFNAEVRDSRVQLANDAIESGMGFDSVQSFMNEAAVRNDNWKSAIRIRNILANGGTLDYVVTQILDTEADKKPDIIAFHVIEILCAEK